MESQSDDVDQLLIDLIYNDYNQPTQQDPKAQTVVAVGRPNYNQAEVYNEILSVKYESSGHSDIDTFISQFQPP